MGAHKKQIMRLLCFLTFTFTSAKLAINGRFDDKLRYELNRHLAQVDIPNAPDVPVDARFTRHNTERLQRALAEYGRLPITSQLDSLAISTFQGYLRSLGFYHDKPCGILGHGTVTAIQEFLTSQGTYRYQTTGSLDSGTKSAMNEYLYNMQQPTSSYRQRHSNLWTHSTTKALRKYLHDIGAKVELTGEAWGVPYKYGRWDSKTTLLLQQFLNDNMPGTDLDLSDNMNYKTIVALREYLNSKM